MGEEDILETLVSRVAFVPAGKVPAHAASMESLLEGPSGTSFRSLTPILGHGDDRLLHRAQRWNVMSWLWISRVSYQITVLPV